VSHRTLPVHVGELGSERGGGICDSTPPKQQLQSDFDKQERTLMGAVNGPRHDLTQAARDSPSSIAL
jgi:hypothetical protein